MTSGSGVRKRKASSKAGAPDGRQHKKVAAPKHADIADIVGQTVVVPAAEFGVDIADLMYRGKVLGKDPHRKGAVVVRFEEDGTRYWLPADEVRRWLGAMRAAGRSPTGPTIGAGADEFAASVLSDLLTEKRRSSCVTGATATSSCSHGSVAGGGGGGAGVGGAVSVGGSGGCGAHAEPAHSCGRAPMPSPPHRTAPEAAAAAATAVAAAAPSSSWRNALPRVRSAGAGGGDGSRGLGEGGDEGWGPDGDRGGDARRSDHRHHGGEEEGPVVWGYTRGRRSPRSLSPRSDDALAGAAFTDAALKRGHGEGESAAAAAAAAALGQQQWEQEQQQHHHHQQQQHARPQLSANSIGVPQALGNAGNTAARPQTSATSHNTWD